MDLFKLGGVDYSPLIIRGGYVLEKAQTWAEGSGRDFVKGRWIGTILGNYTNPVIEIVMADSLMLANLETLLLSGSIEVAFYDTRTRSVRTRIFYRANYKITLLGFYDEGTNLDYDTITIEFVAHERD